MSKITMAEAKTLLKKSQVAPEWFWQIVLGGRPWGRQVEILRSVWHNSRTAVRSCHGAGKSWSAARIGISFLCTFPGSIVVTTAPTGRQVKMILWQEWRRAVKTSKRPLGGELLKVEHRMADGWYAFGFATDIPDNFQGIHARHILVIADEAAGIMPNVAEAIDSLLTSENARLLAIGNPTDPNGWFAGLFKDPGVTKIHISAFDTPNFTAFGITEQDIAEDTWEQKITGPLPYPELVTPAWVAERYRKWGPTSPMYIARVLGDFPEAGDNTLIPLSWVEAAMERWYEIPEGEIVEFGADIARYGGDSTVIAIRYDNKVLPLVAMSKLDLMEITGKIVALAREHKPRVVKVDAIGYGAGVVDRLKELKEPVVGIEVSRAPTDQEHFADLTSELWWNLREMLNPDTVANPNPVALPPDDELLGQLTSRRYSYTSRGQVKVESKDDMKKRGLSSPDRADAVVLAFAAVRDNRFDPEAVKLLKAVRIYG